jgi:hypothetical protein
MQFVAICLVAIFLGVRGFRVRPRTYVLGAAVAAAAAIYTYH